MLAIHISRSTTLYSEERSDSFCVLSFVWLLVSARPDRSGKPQHRARMQTAKPADSHQIFLYITGPTTKNK